jgi:PAT family beta-lactamase induction signal transducer AmpG
LLLIVGLNSLSNFFVISLAVFVAAFVCAAPMMWRRILFIGFRKRPTIFFSWNQKYILQTFYAYRKRTVVIAGYLEQEYGDKQQAWSYTMIVVGLIMTLITVYNYSTQKSK